MPTTYSVLAVPPRNYQGAIGTATTYAVNVIRSGDTSAALDVPWQASNTSNTIGADFVGGVFPSGSIHFNPGQTSAQINVRVAGGNLPFGFDGTFEVSLGVQNSGSSSGFSESGGGVGVSHHDYTVTSGGGNALPNTLTGNSGKDVLNGNSRADILDDNGGSVADKLFEGGGNTLTLARADVLAISSSTDTLKIFGDGGDSANAAGFLDLGITGAFHEYKSGAAILLVDTDITNVA